MLVIPAIDLMGGKAVRLQEGDPRRATVYADDPRTVLRDFLAAGARRVHVVDLDGAFAGRPVQTDLMRELVRVAHEGGAEVQVGGGLRDPSAVLTMLDTGADFVVVGTLAVRDPDAAAQILPQRARAALVGSGGVPSIRPVAMSSLWASSWRTTLPIVSPRPPARAASQARTTGPPSMASPITVVACPTGARGCSKNPRGRGGTTRVEG